MTKLNWDKANLRVPDPGAMVEAPEDFSTPERWKPPSKVRAAARARAKQQKIAQERQATERAREILRNMDHTDAEVAILKKAKRGEPLHPLEQRVLDRLLK